MVYVPDNPLAERKQKKKKYKNKIVHADGKRFDSVKERDRYFFLKDEQKAGRIRNLRAQVPFKLEVNGELICRYIADFVYEKNMGFIYDGMSLSKGSVIETDHHAWSPVVEDVKSAPTAKLPLFKIKAKLMKAVHGVEISIVKNVTAKI